MIQCVHDEASNACTKCGRPFGAIKAQRQCIVHGFAGRELKSLLKDWLGIEPVPGCQCNHMAAKMDLLGPDWCESSDGMTEILQVMRAEHAARKSDGLTSLPWSDFAAKQLVLLACRRARAKAGG